MDSPSPATQIPTPIQAPQAAKAATSANRREGPAEGFDAALLRVEEAAQAASATTAEAGANTAPPATANTAAWAQAMADMPDEPRLIRLPPGQETLAAAGSPPSAEASGDVPAAGEPIPADATAMPGWLMALLAPLPAQPLPTAATGASATPSATAGSGQSAASQPGGAQPGAARFNVAQAGMMAGMGLAAPGPTNGRGTAALPGTPDHTPADATAARPQEGGVAGDSDIPFAPASATPGTQRLDPAKNAGQASGTQGQDAPPLPAFPDAMKAAAPPEGVVVAGGNTPPGEAATSGHATGHHAADAPPPASAPAPSGTAPVQLGLATPTPGIAPPSATPTGAARPVSAPPRAAPVAPARQIMPVTIAMAMAPGQTARLTVALEPAELGKVEIQVERSEDAGTTMVHIMAERPETLALLQRDAPMLDRALQQAGLPAGDRNFSFSLASQDNGGQAQGQGQPRQAGGRRGGVGGGMALAPLAFDTQPPPGRPLGLLDIAV